MRRNSYLNLYIVIIRRSAKPSMVLLCPVSLSIIHCVIKNLVGWGRVQSAGLCMKVLSYKLCIISLHKKCGWVIRCVCVGGYYDFAHK